MVYANIERGSEDMLTAKQEKFVQCIIEGMSQADAYRAAYDTKRMTDKTVHEKASRMMADGKVRARLTELRAELVKPTIMTAQERLEYLTRVIKGEIGEKVPQKVDDEIVEVDVPTSLKNKLNAIDIMNKMQGEYVQKVEADVKGEVCINIELSDD
jgi:phage terminase small subunit